MKILTEEIKNLEKSLKNEEALIKDQNSKKSSFEKNISLLKILFILIRKKRF